MKSFFKKIFDGNTNKSVWDMSPMERQKIILNKIENFGGSDMKFAEFQNRVNGRWSNKTDWCNISYYHSEYKGSRFKHAAIFENQSSHKIEVNSRSLAIYYKEAVTTESAFSDLNGQTTYIEKTRGAYDVSDIKKVRIKGNEIMIVIEESTELYAYFYEF